MPPRDDEVQALVEQLSADLDRSVLVDDASLRLLAYSPTLGSEDEVRRTAILTRETPRVIRDLHFSQGIATATQPVRTAAAAGHRAGVARVRADPLPGRAVRLPVADRRRRVADRRRLRGGRALRRPRSAPRCTAATNSRSRSGSSRCGCSRCCSADDPAQREAAAHELAAGDVLVAGAAVGVLAVRRPRGEPESELGAAERARLGLALDQFRRTLPRRHALSTVHADHGVLIAALSERGRRSPSSPAARRTRSTPRSPAKADAMIGYSDLVRAPARRPPRPRARPSGAAASRPRCPSTAHLPAGRTSAPTGCSPAPRRRRTPRELIHPGLPKLFALQSKESLVQTLEAYLDNGCDTKLTAEALFLHRASLYYRLQRIEAITSTQPQERRGPPRAALRAQTRAPGGHASSAETHQHRLDRVATLV